MRAARFSSFGGPEVLEVVDRPDPTPGPGQVRVAVRAAGLNGTDVKLRRGELDEELPQTTGRDVAGVVDRLGPGVEGVTIGDRVFGPSDEAAAVAELDLLTFHAPIPAALGFVDAAGLPVALETATRGLDALGVAAGHTLLVNGASGGIGSTAVQLALARGARVVGTAGAANQAYVRSLGAECVGYGPGLLERVRAVAPDGVDRALDVAGHDALPDLVALTGAADRVVTLADPIGARALGIAFSTGAHGRAMHALAEVGPLIAAGRFWLPVERTFALDDIVAAHRLLEDGHVRGRIVVVVS